MSARMLIAGAALAVGLAAGALLPREALPPARAQSLLPAAEVDWQVLGRVDGTQLVYIEFPDGSRCLATDGGAGTLDCDWGD